MEEEKKSSELTIGEKIRDLREKRGFSLQDMANRTG